jgi:hypothetical protein
VQYEPPLPSLTLVEHDEYVFLADNFDEDELARWSRGREDSPEVVERVINEVNFGRRATEPWGEIAALEEDAARFADSLRRALADACPNRRMTVETWTDPNSRGPSVSFHQRGRCPCRHCLEQWGPPV